MVRVRVRVRVRVSKCKNDYENLASPENSEYGDEKKYLRTY